MDFEDRGSLQPCSVSCAYGDAVVGQEPVFCTGASDSTACASLTRTTESNNSYLGQDVHGYFIGTQWITGFGFYLGLNSSRSVKANTGEPESARHLLFSPVPLFKPYGDIPGVFKNVCVWVCISNITRSERQRSIQLLVCVKMHSCTRQKSESVFLHMLLTVSMHDMICVTSHTAWRDTTCVPAAAPELALSQCPLLFVSLLSQYSHQICSAWAHTEKKRSVWVIG